MAEKFDSDKDVLVLVTQRSNVSLDGLNSLLECARKTRLMQKILHIGLQFQDICLEKQKIVSE